MESQISSVPIWLRNTPEYLKNDGAKPINLMNHVRSLDQSASTTKNYHDDYDLKFNPSAEQTKTEYTVHAQDQVISKSKLMSAEIERELNSIEDDWRVKYRVKKASEEEKTKDPAQKHGIFRHRNVSEKQVASLDSSHRGRQALQDIEGAQNAESVENVINKKFIESTLIHSKPSGLYHLGKIFQIVNGPVSGRDV